MKHVVRVLKWVVILVVVFGLAFAVYVAVKINQPLKTVAAEKEFTIAAGTLTRQVAADLQGDHLIGNALFFRIYLHFKAQGNHLQAGTYLLSPTMSIRQIAEVLTSGKVLDTSVRFTVIEGWTVADISAALKDAGILSANQALKLSPSQFAAQFPFLAGQPAKYASLEGFLFPDTYQLNRAISPQEVAIKMLANFDRKLTPDLRGQIQNQGQTVFQIVTLASIIEREVGRNLQKGDKLSPQDLALLGQERRIVAGIFYNRLRLGMALESDATVNYLTNRKSNRATKADLQIDSPYNTYKYRGLPPGPIANPSLDAILAAINPTKTGYLYFVTGPDGTAHFAKTLQEQNANKKKYLQ